MFLMLFIVCGVFNVGTVSAASGSLGYTLLGTHPQAAAQPTDYGKSLNSLKIFNGKLHAGYGDYGVNTGPIHVNPFNLSLGQFSGSQLSVPTEEINNWVIINGVLYAPYIDPQGGPVTTGGYASGEPWVNNTVIPSSIHNYDMATLTGTDLWMVGSGDMGSAYGAVAWRSTNGGTTWNVVQSETEAMPDGGERYLWVAELGGKIYMQASGIVGAPVRIFDGSTWTTGTTQTVAPDPTHVEVFANKIITVTGDRLNAYDGTNLTTVNYFEGLAEDMYVNGGYLYILRNNDTIVRTSDLVSWQELGNAQTNSKSIAVDNGIIYLGTAGSQIFKSTVVIPGSLTVSLTAPSNSTTVSGNVAFNVNLSNIPINRVEFVSGSTILTSSTVSPYSAVWDTKSSNDGTYSVYARVYDDYGNVAVSTPISLTVSNPASTGNSSLTTQQAVTATVSRAGLPRSRSGTAVIEPSTDLVLTEPESNTEDPCKHSYNPNLGARQTKLALWSINNAAAADDCLPASVAQTQPSNPRKVILVAGGVSAISVGLFVLFRATILPSLRK